MIRLSTPPQAVVRLAAAALAIALLAVQSAGTTTAQEDPKDTPLSWTDLPRAPRHRSQADWLIDVGWETADDLFRSFTVQDYHVGDQERFMSLGSLTGLPSTFVLRYRTEHAYFWFESDIEVDDATLARVATFFERRIWPLDTAVYGDDDTLAGERLHILHQNDIWSGVMGAFSPDDQCPRVLCPESNEGKFLYINLGITPIETDEYLGTVAHELQHLIQHDVDGNETRWLDEGLSQLAEHLNGFPPKQIAGPLVHEFLDDPDLQLNSWSNSPIDIDRHYGSAYLFLVYLYDHFGLDFIHELALVDKDGLAAVDTLLRAAGEPDGVDGVFADWIVANYLDDPFVGDGRYYYETMDMPVQVQPQPLRTAGNQFARVNSVQQYAADYFVLDEPGRYTLRFAGAAQVHVLDVAPSSADWMWWSTSRSSSATRLTGAFDLTRLQTATLEFNTWWDIEQDYDWFQVLVSADGGATWSIIGGDKASPAQGKIPGVYYSGTSDHWLRERIDLSDFTGGPVLIRFEYLTDSSEDRPGVALDDIAIVEMGYLDDVEQTPSVWYAEGFLRMPRTVPQSWSVTLLQDAPDGSGLVAAPLPLDADQSGSVQVTITEDRPLTVIVGAMAPFTEVPATYSLRALRAN